MKTEIIDRTTHGGSAKESQVGKEGYFWDTENGLMMKDTLSYIRKCGNDYSFIASINGSAYKYFSESIPEWFMPKDLTEKKPIELVWSIQDDGSTQKAGLNPLDFEKIERIAADVEGFDLLKCTNLGGVIFYLGHWNDGVV